MYVVIRRSSYDSVIGPFKTWDEAEKYRDRLVQERREAEDKDKYLLKGGVSFFVLTLEESNPNLVTPEPKCDSGYQGHYCCEHKS